MKRIAAVVLAASLAACGAEEPGKAVPVATGAALATAPVELRETELTYSAEAVLEAVRQSTSASTSAM